MRHVFPGQAVDVIEKCKRRHPEAEVRFLDQVLPCLSMPLTASSPGRLCWDEPSSIDMAMDCIKSGNDLRR